MNCLIENKYIQGKKRKKKRKKNILNFSIHKWICLIENEY